MKRLGVLIVCLLIRVSSVTAQQSSRGAATADTLCINGLSDKLQFFDYKSSLLIRNYLSGQHYIYWKSQKRLDTIQIDTNLVKRIYTEYFKDTAACLDYMSLVHKTKFRPKIESVTPYDDTSILACLVTYKSGHTAIQGSNIKEIYDQVPSMLRIGMRKSAALFFINEALPIPLHYMGFDLLTHNGTVYCTLNPDTEDSLVNPDQMHNLARMKRKGPVYGIDRVMSTTLNDYLIANKVFDNYNKTFFDNGYSLMSLSNYIFNLETGKKIYLPIADSVFRNIRIDPETYAINYCLYDFKYNAAENRFYISYKLDKRSYVASFQPSATVFLTNDLIYFNDSDFCRDMKNECLSWDGKKILYCMKGENVFRYATVTELQEAARNYKRPVSE